MILLFAAGFQVQHVFKIHQLQSQQKNWANKHKKDIFDEIIKDFDPQKKYLKKINIDSSTTQGNWISGGDAGGIPYPQIYEISFTSYLNGEESYKLKIYITFPDTRGKRVFKTKTNPFEEQPHALETYDYDFKSEDINRFLLQKSKE